MRVSLSPVHNEHTPQHVQVDGNVVWILSRQCADCCHTIPNRVYAIAEPRHVLPRFTWHGANVYRRGNEPSDRHCGDGNNERGGVFDFWRWVYVKRSGFAFGWNGGGYDDLRQNEKHSRGMGSPVPALSRLPPPSRLRVLWRTGASTTA